MERYYSTVFLGELNNVQTVCTWLFSQPYTKLC